MPRWPTRTTEERYWDKIAVRGPDECWPWTGGLGGNPYGSLWTGTRHVTATRWGYELRVGPIPEGQHVLHTCDTPACHNDRHWFLGTIADNNRDRQRKGRTRLPDNAGARHGMARLTDLQIAEIRERYSTGNVKQSDLALEYGIGQQQVSRIIRRTSWT